MERKFFTNESLKGFAQSMWNAITNSLNELVQPVINELAESIEGLRRQCSDIFTIADNNKRTIEGVQNNVAELRASVNELPFWSQIRYCGYLANILENPLNGEPGYIFFESENNEYKTRLEHCIGVKFTEIKGPNTSYPEGMSYYFAKSASNKAATELRFVGMMSLGEELEGAIFPVELVLITDPFGNEGHCFQVKAGEPIPYR